MTAHETSGGPCVSTIAVHACTHVLYYAVALVRRAALYVVYSIVLLRGCGHGKHLEATIINRHTLPLGMALTLDVTLVHTEARTHAHAGGVIKAAGVP